jgi:sugar lactone lactonase YvrE
MAVLISVNLHAQSLSGVESVEYDPLNNRYLASSDNTSIVAIAPDGTLSYFGNGLTADYGMEVAGNTLFAVAGTRIKGYDLTTATQVMDLNITGALFLNGLASDGADRLWVSDFNGYDIYEVNISDLQNPTYQMVADQTDLGTTNKPNGLVHDAANNRVLFVNWGSNAPIKALDLGTYAVSTIIANTVLENIDGIDRDNEGRWYVASWSPARITRYSNDFSTSEIITVTGINSPADICYATQTDTLAIPGGNQVLFIGFESSVVGVGNDGTLQPFNVHYVHGAPVVRFELNAPQTVDLTLHDMSGRTVLTLLQGMQPSGRHTVPLAVAALPAGNYVCRIASMDMNAAEQVLIP